MCRLSWPTSRKRSKHLRAGAGSVAYPADAPLEPDSSRCVRYCCWPSMVPAALRPHCCRHARCRRELQRRLLSQSRDRVLGHEPRYGQTPCPRVAGLLPACQPPASGADHRAAPPRRFSVHSPCVRARRRICICTLMHVHVHTRICTHPATPVPTICAAACVAALAQ